MRKPIPLSELLAKGNPTFERLRDGAAAADRTLSAVQQALPEEVRPHVWGASTAGGVLTLLVDTAGWATRVRYAVPDLRAALGDRLGAPVGRVQVRVRPPSGRAAPRPG
jgi:hypothetical protein